MNGKLDFLKQDLISASNEMYSLSKLLEMHTESDLPFDAGMRLGLAHILSRNASSLNRMLELMGQDDVV